MIDLQECRNEIDKIDSDISHLSDKGKRAKGNDHILFPGK